jgi:hypothetical protein
MHAQSENSKVMLVAIEYGGEWRVNVRPSAGVDLIMVVQLAGEDPLLFARRFLAKVLSVTARGADVASAVLAVAPIFDVRHLEARCTIARTLLRVFRSDSKSELHLVEPCNASLDCRPHLLAMAEGLTEGAQTDCKIRLGHETISRAGTVSARTGG